MTLQELMESNLIDGSWVSGDGLVRSHNPSDPREQIGIYSCASDGQVDDAVTAARRAFPNWSKLGFSERAGYLKKVAHSLYAEAAELGELLSREEGKPLREGVGEVLRASELFEYYAGECLRQFAEKGESIRTGVTVEVKRRPVGVIAVVTPWNFPVALPCWKIAPALAYGNTVVFKPSELIPATSIALAKILEKSDLPPGVFNLILGIGPQVGERLISSDRIDAVSFTGSVPTGEAIARQSIRNMTRIQLEMGGKNPLVLLDDADLALGIECAVQGAFFSAGQRCTASSRLIVQEKIADAFVDGLSDRMSKLKIGNALDDETDIGPLVSSPQLDRVLEYIDIGKNEGAALCQGGRRLEVEGEGHFLEPTLFLETTVDMRINQEEIFGPVASVIVVGDYEEALAAANATDFGLTAGIITGNDKLSRHFCDHAEAGVVTVNMPTVGLDFHVPFGGVKRSSYGPREQGQYARDFFTETTVNYVAV